MPVTFKKYRVVYFVPTAAPTPEMWAKLEEYGPHAAFRNSLFASDDVEACDAWLGEAPASYREALPEAVTYADFVEGRLPARPEPPAEPVEADNTMTLPLPPGVNPFASLDAPDEADGTSKPRFVRPASRKAPEWNRNA